MKANSIHIKLIKRILLIGLASFLLSIMFAMITFWPYHKKQYLETASKANEEIIQQLDNALGFVEEYSTNLAIQVERNNEISQYIDNPSRSNRDLANLTLMNIISSTSYIRCVSIDSHTHTPVNSLRKYTNEDENLLKTEWYEQLKNDQFNKRFSEVYDVQINNILYRSSSYVRNFYQNNRWITYTVTFNLNDLLFRFERIANDRFDDLFLYDGSEEAFFSYSDEESDPNQISADEIDQAQDQTSGTTRFVTKSIKSDWYMISLISDQKIFSTFVPTIIGISFSILTLLTMILFAVSYSVRGMLKPILKLSNSMRHAATGNMDFQVDVNGTDEIAMLGHTFNKMIRDLKQSLSVISQQEKQKQQIKYSLLVSQIDPHFICNTLNSLNYLARKNRTDEIVKVNSALISIIRDTLRFDDFQISDTIAHEMKVIDEYMIIQKFMYGDNLEFYWHVDQELHTLKIPKNLIQPIVENAIVHGLIDEQTGELSGRIDVYIKKDTETILIEVVDNGVGISPEALKELQNQDYKEAYGYNRIGLSNIRKRLFYLYGSDDRISIESIQGEGAKVTLRLPDKDFDNS